MKKSIIITLATVLISLSSSAQSSSTKTKEVFKVYGNCGMCEKTIEASLKGSPGVYDSDWDVKSKKMTVSYNPSKTSLDKIKKKIAASGYDTDSHRATDKKYNSLHGCCQYERPK